MTRRHSLPAACLALAVVWLLAASTAQAGTPKDFFGVGPQRPLSDQDFDRMAQAKVGTLRFELNWSAIDPAAPAGDFDWASSDRIVGAAARKKIQPLPFAYSTPPWVARLDGHNCDEGECLPFAPRGGDALSAWRAFLAAAARRYGPGGEFWSQNPEIPERPIRVWQLWNEQNSPSFFKPKPDVGAYASLLETAGRAIRGEDRRAEIVLGGMFGTPLGGEKPAIAAWDFLEKLYRRKGVERDFDGVAAHPYAPTFDNVEAQVKLLRDEIKDAGDAKADLWITEIGWASDGPSNPLNRGPSGQAERLKQTFKYFKRKRRKLNIRNVDWYSWRDDATDGAGLCEWCPFSGLLTDDAKAKPALRAFTKFTGGRP